MDRSEHEVNDGNDVPLDAALALGEQRGINAAMR